MMGLRNRSVPRRTATLPILVDSWWGLAVLGLALVIAPFVLADYQLTLAATGAAYSVAVLGVALGFASSGMLALMQPAMMLIGAYVGLYFIDDLGASFAVSGVAAMLVGVIVALPLGWLTSRLDKFSFGVLGFAFSYLVSMLMSSSMLVHITGGELGKPFPTPSVLGIPLTESTGYVAVAAGVLVAHALAPLMFRSRLGRTLIIMKENDALAQSMGIDSNIYRILVTAIVSAYGSFSGLLIGVASGFIAPPQFDVALSISLLAMALVGGTRYLLGPLVGTVVLQVLPAMTGLTLVDRNLLVGVVLLACLVFTPQGLLSISTFAAGLNLTSEKKQHQ